VCLGDVPGARQKKSEGVLSGGDDVRLGGVDDHDPNPGGGLGVDVVEPDAGPADDDEVAAGLEDLRGDLGRRADDEGVRPRYRSEERRGVEIELDVDVEAGGGHGVEPAGGELFGYENAHCCSFAGQALASEKSSPIRSTPLTRSSSESA